MKVMGKVFEVDEKKMTATERYSEGAGSKLTILDKLRDPACLVVIEDFPVGANTTRMGFWFPELQIVISGKAEVEYATSTPAVGFWEKGKFVAEAGDAYLIDKGDQVSFKVLSVEAYRHLAIMMPLPPYAAPAAPENHP